MRLPDMKYGDRIAKNKQIKFGGLNRSISAEDGQLRDMMNLTSDHSPVLGSRERRMLYVSLEKPGGFYSWSGLCWVDGTTFYYSGEAKGEVAEGMKTFASLGPWIVILPDKRCYNVDTGEFKNMEAVWEGESLTFTNGLRFEEDAEANTIRCQDVTWSDWFSVGDAVSIEGCAKHPENNKSVIIRDMDGDKLYFSENVFTLDDGKEYTEEVQLRITRRVPELKYVFEHENRLWGCSDSTIYASVPGNIFNWFVYDGLASDAWALTPGSVGPFTGAVSYRGYATFFKEDHIYKVYGSIPSNFEVMGSATLGLAEGSARSLAIAGETLFYLSRSGMMAYTGGIPQPVGQAFGTQRLRNAVGGSDGLKYYVNMENEDGVRWLYVYDTQRGMWHKEDQANVLAFARWDGNLYFLNDEGQIWITGSIENPPEGAAVEEDVAWMAEFTDFTEEDPNMKGVSKLQLRLELEEGAHFQAQIQFDSDGVWHNVRSISGQGSKRSYYLPIVPRRCDHYRIQLRGTGVCRVYSMVRETYSGSERKSLPGR